MVCDEIVSIIPTPETASRFIFKSVSIYTGLCQSIKDV